MQAMGKRSVRIEDIPLLVRLRLAALFKTVKTRQILGVIALILLVTGVAAFRQYEISLGVESVKLPTLSDVSRGVTIYDGKDRYVCSINTTRDCHPVPLTKISPNIQKAVIAAEDHNFYSHKGVDPVGIARAMWANHRAGHIVQGASTITQQLARNLYLDKNDKSLNRKMREILLSWQIDSRYSKGKILETYLNEVYFGGGVYGIERASQYYFNSNADKLSIAQSAFLAGVIRSPSFLGTPQHRKEALERQKQIINKMKDYNLISSVDSQAALTNKLAFKPGPPSMPYPYYVGYVMEILKSDLGADLNKRNWRVYTNLDVGAQKAAVKILNRGIKNAPFGIDQGALVSMSLKDGAVLAMVGGVGDNKNAWNRAIFPHTAGSSFKPFVYLAALKDGILQTDTVVNDAPLTISSPGTAKYEPRNFDGQFKGWLPVRSALATSRNICCIRVAQEVGMNSVVDVARAAGIKSKMDTYPSAALGTCAVSPLDMASAYATLARGGVYMPPQMLRYYKSTDGKIKRTYYPTASANLPQEASAQLVDLMQDVVASGTGTQARLAGIAVAGKTGTADKATDIWFTGFTPDTVTSVWGGNDKVRAVHGTHVTGGTVMAHIWHDYMRAYYGGHKAPVGIALAKPSQPLMRSLTPFETFEGLASTATTTSTTTTTTTTTLPAADLATQTGFSTSLVENSLLANESATTTVTTYGSGIGSLTLADLTGDELKMMNTGIGPWSSVPRLREVDTNLVPSTVAQTIVRTY